ncbi:hypothetical protein GCM10009740_29080 [Terrabacter terrae]|uniref:Uncharacterized protein n=1 Tax=Terrabacter terrae TaxID=318434 RepID=A0ABP5G1A8_9MICO
MGEQPRNESPQVFEVHEVEERDRPVDEPRPADEAVEVPAREVITMADEPRPGEEEGVGAGAAQTGGGETIPSPDEAPRADATADANVDELGEGFSDAGAAAGGDVDGGYGRADTTAGVPDVPDVGAAGSLRDRGELSDQGDLRDQGDQGDGRDEAQGEVGAGPDGGHVRVGEETSSGVKYSQEITSPDEEPEREGRSLATTHHEVIKEWAEERGATPATVDGTEHGDHLGVLRLDFGGNNQNLRHVSWDEWFHTFDVRRLNFIYQENRRDGRQSNFFRVESPDREDG